MIYNAINNNLELKKLALNIEKFEYVSLDFEFIRTTTFFPVISTMQVEVNGCLYLIDFMENNINLNIFKNIFLNKKITKIFHSCRQDIELIYYYTNIIPVNIFDVQKAYAIISNEDSISYDKVLNNLGIDTQNYNGKKYDWGVRPLLDEMKEYAVRDVMFLHAAKNCIEKIIKKNNRMEILNYNMFELENINLYKPNIVSLYKTYCANIENRCDEIKLFNICYCIILTAIIFNTPKHKIVSKNNLKQFSKSFSLYDLKIPNKYRKMFFYIYNTKKHNIDQIKMYSKNLNNIQIQILAQFNQNLAKYETENKISKNTIISKEKIKNIIQTQSYGELKYFQAIILGINPEIYNIPN